MARAWCYALSAILAIAMAPALVSALSVGVAPPVLDAGDMLPGESKAMEFFIMSDHDRDLLVSLDAKTAPRNFFNPDKGRFRYDFDAMKASEEDASGWLTIMKDSLLVPPERELKYLEGGGVAYANRKAEIIISVPEDAEPGYHAAFVSPYPRVSDAGGGTALGIISVVELGVVFNVLGNAERDAEPVGVSFRKDSPERGTLTVLVKNRGTVTLSAMAPYIRVYDDENQTVAELRTNARPIEPGSVGRLEAGLDASGLEGEYSVRADVEWVTGQGSAEGAIDIGDYVPPRPVTGQAVSPLPAPAGLQLWVLPLILLVITGLVFWRVRS